MTAGKAQASTSAPNFSRRTLCVLAVCLAAVPLVGGLSSPARADWRAASQEVSPNGARFGTATMLDDGRILVAGGRSGTTFLDTAEIYDPAADSWAAAAPMGDARENAAAVLLGDGRVLVCGGDGSSGGTAFECERYDPGLNVWLSTAGLPTAYSAPKIVSLADGRALIWTRGSGAARIYDPGTNRWTTVSFMPQVPGTDTVGTRLADGRVFVVVSNTSSVDEIYNPSTNVWTTTDSGVKRGIPTLTPLADGTLLVAGGAGVSLEQLASAQIFDPATNSWSSAGSMEQARYLHSATLMPDGKVLVAGGATTRTNFSAEAEVYDPASNTWSQAPSLRTGRHGHWAFALETGTVLLVGGTADASTYLNAPELYDPPTPTWSATGPLATVHSDASGAALADGRVLVAGGYDGLNVLKAAELYDPVAGTWSSAGSMHTGHRFATARALADGRVLIAGGNDFTGPDQDLADVYDPATGSWTTTGPMVHPEVGGTATLLGNGKVLVAGGYDPVADVTRASAQLYEPATNSWSAASDMSGPRSTATAALLADGRVLVAGGFDGTVFDLKTAEVYDPATNTWTTVASMPFPREAGLAARLDDGRVLVAAGQEFSTLPTGAVLYDPVADNWSDAGTIHTGRVFTALVTDRGGEPTLVAGSDGTPAPLTSVEVYDQHLNAWFADGDLTAARASFVAALLPSGQILAAGGSSDHGNLSSAELSPKPSAVKVANTGFVPASVTVKPLGRAVRWTVKRGTHSVTESGQLGPNGMPLFDSGSLTPGSRYSHAFVAAGTYGYSSTSDQGMTGTVKVPVQAALSSDGYRTLVGVRWATSLMPGYVFDAQYRYMPSGGSFGPWTAWTPRGSSTAWRDAQGVFTPSPGSGTYQFRARLRNVGTDNAGDYSPPATVVVP